MTPTLPTMRDPDNLVYFREEVGGLCMGGYERHPAPWSLDGIPPDFNGRLLAPDWPRFEEIMDGAVRRVPAIGDAGINRMINGPEGFTPDNEFILGESDVRGFFVAAGFCAHGIAGAGGIGRQVATWIVDGEPELDLWKMDIRRFGAQYRSQAYTLARTVEVYATYYDIHYPNEERQAGRPLRLAPTYPRLVELGAAFGEKSGWERPNWFESNAAGGDEGLRPRGWAGRHWSPAIGAEAAGDADRGRALRRVELQQDRGRRDPGRPAFLQRLCANDIDRPVGSIVYTQMLNRRGRIECDFTVTRLAAERYLIVTGTAFGNHDLGWIRKNLDDLRSEVGPVLVEDRTSGLACLGLWGPRARDILAACTRDDVSDDAFPYLTARRITVGSVPLLALRVTYVGELGWELYPPTEYGLALWDTLWAAGREHGLVAAGYRAIDALRLEKGYRVWSSDITPDETPYEAGLGFAVRLDKEVDFIGREALEAARAAGPTPTAALPRPRRPALDRPRQRAGPDRRRDRRPGHQRRLRLRRRALDRLRLPAAGPGRGRDARRGRGLRAVGRLRGRGRAALRPAGREDPLVNDGGAGRSGSPGDGNGSNELPAWEPGRRSRRPSGRPGARAGRAPRPTSSTTGWPSPRRPATRRTRSRCATSGATSRS